MIAREKKTVSPGKRGWVCEGKGPREIYQGKSSHCNGSGWRKPRRSRFKAAQHQKWGIFFAASTGIRFPFGVRYHSTAAPHSRSRQVPVVRKTKPSRTSALCVRGNRFLAICILEELQFDDDDSEFFELG